MRPVQTDRQLALSDFTPFISRVAYLSFELPLIVVRSNVCVLDEVVVLCVFLVGVVKGFAGVLDAVNHATEIEVEIVATLGGSGRGGLFLARLGSWRNFAAGNKEKKASRNYPNGTTDSKSGTHVLSPPPSGNVPTRQIMALAARNQ